LAVTIVATIWLPVSMATTAAATVSTLLTLYFSTLPIGGLTDDSAALAYTNIIPYNEVLSLLSEAFPNPAGGSYVNQATMTLNGGTSNVSMLSTQVAVLGVPTIVVNGV